MADTLLDALKQNLAAPPVQPLAPLGQTEEAKSLLRTKLTGQAAPTDTGPARYNAAELSAQETSQSALGQTLAQGRMQAENLGQQQAAQESQRELARTQHLQDVDSRKRAFNQQTVGILHDFEQGKKQLNSLRDIADIEQVGFAARLQNEQYVDSLANEAAKARLDNDAKFKEDYYKQVFADQSTLLNNDIAFQKVMGQNTRDFTKEMSVMSMDNALDMARNAIKAQQTASQYTALGGLASGAMQAGTAAYNSNQAETRNSTEWDRVEKQYANDPAKLKQIQADRAAGLSYAHDYSGI